MPHVEDGDKRYIRKEYTETSKLGGDDDAIEVEPAGIPSVEPASADE